MTLADDLQAGTGPVVWWSRPSSKECSETDAVAIVPFDWAATIVSVAKVPPTWWARTS